ncbi:MAG: hypothetical protein Q8P36_00315 [bacterium]|nr:hypothetical protein [bacterium]
MTTKALTASAIATMLLVLPALALAEEVGVSGRVDVSASTTRPGPLERLKGEQASTTIRVKVTASTTRPNSDDRIEKARERANQEIERRIANLNKLSGRISDMKRISTDQKSGLSAMIQVQIDALIALGVRIDSESATSSLKADIQSITKSYRIYALIMPQAALIASADRALAVATQMEAFSAKLSARIDAVATTGVDVSLLRDSLSDYNANVADAKVQAQAAISAVTALKPDNGDQAVFQANLAVLKSARAKVQAAQQGLVAARKDAKDIVKSIRGLGLHATATTTATTP